MSASQRALALSLFMSANGAMHFIARQAYAAIVPRALPNRRAVVKWSGVAELVCAGALAVPATRRTAGYATAALFVAVFPANVQMALDGGVSGAPFPFRSATFAWLRLPLQLPLIRWALRVARRESR